MGPNIFEYTNYRDFLKAYYAYAKEKINNFSHRYFGMRVGFTSPNFLQRIMNGDRNLTKDYVPKFARAMGLTKKEQQYFDVLVSFNQAKTPEAKRYYLELIHNLKKGRISTELSDEQYEYVSRWYYPVIREMVMLTDFQEDPKWICAALDNKITHKQVSDAICTLLKLGLLRRDTEGRLAHAETHVATSHDVQDICTYSFHQQILSLAKEALSTVKAENREFSGVTLTISQKQFNEIRDKMREFENSIINYVEHNPDVPETVCQLNLTFFPFTVANNGGK